MPNQSSNQTALRGRHRVGVHVSVMIGNVVLTGTVSATPASASALNVAYTLVSGSEADVRPGMRVVVSNGGLFKGFLSIRFAGTINSTNLPVREFSLGELIVESGDTITVYDDLVLTDKLVSADDTFAPDHTAYVDQNSNPAPVAVSGGAWAGWLGEGGTVDIPFVGSGSYAIDPDSGGSLTHAWACASGTWDDDTAADPTLTLTTAGKYLVTHAVTDASNSKTETQLIRVRVHDDADLPYDCELANVEGDPLGGFRTSFKVYENASLTAIPDGAPVIVWSQEWMDGTEQSFGAAVPSRAHIICTGFFRRDRASGNAGNDELEFEIVSPLARLAELPGFSKALERNQAPDTWQEVKTLTVKRGLVKLLRDYTNALEMFDLVFDGFDDADYVAFYLQKQNPFEQLRELADSRDARLICDRTGRIEVQGRLEFTPLADRAAITLTITLEDDDILDYEISREHNRPLETYRTRGFTAGTDANVVQPAFARAPSSPARGNLSATIEKLIVDDTSDLYARCALRMAWEDSVYFDADGVQQHAPSVRLTLFGNYAQLFQFYREWVQLDGMVNLRGIDLSEFRFIVQRVNVEYAGMTATTTLELRAETHAPPEASVDDTPASDLSYAALDYPVLIPIPITSTPSDGLLAGGTQRIIAINTDGYAYLTTNFNAFSPTWSRVALAVDGTIQDSVGDAFTSNRIVIVTSTKIYTLDDPRGAATLTERFSFPASTATGSRNRSIEASFGDRFFFVLSGYGNTGGHTGTWYTYSTDGETWATETQAAAQYETGGGAYNPGGLYLSSRNPGAGVFSAVTTTGLQSAAEAKLFSIGSYGGSVSQISVPTDYVPGDIASYGIHVPFHDNPSDAIVYFNTFRYASAPDVIMRRKNADGSISTDISPQKGGDKLGARDHRSLHTCPLDRLSVVVCATNSGVPARSGVFVSRDGGATWAELTTTTTTDHMRAEFAGDDRNIVYLWGNNGAIGLAKYTSGAWAIGDKRGNIPADYPSAGKFTRLYGM